MANAAAMLRTNASWRNAGAANGGNIATATAPGQRDGDGRWRRCGVGVDGAVRWRCGAVVVLARNAAACAPPRIARWRRARAPPGPAQAPVRAPGAARPPANGKRQMRSSLPRNSRAPRAANQPAT